MYGVIAESNQRFVHVESERNFRSRATFNRICRSNDAASNNISVTYCKIEKLF